MAAAIPTGRENTQPHLGQGVIPLANALICAADKTMKNTQNSTNAGRMKQAA